MSLRFKKETGYVWKVNKLNQLESLQSEWESDFVEARDLKDG